MCFRKKKFERTVQPFAARVLKFLLVLNVKFLKRSTKVCCIFLGGIKAFLWTACCCQKVYLTLSQLSSYIMLCEWQLGHVYPLLTICYIVT